MKRPMVTRTIEATVIRCIISAPDGHCVTRSIDIPGKNKNPSEAIDELRNNLAHGYALTEVLYTKRERVKCTMSLNEFYSCSSHEVLDEQ